MYLMLFWRNAFLSIAHLALPRYRFWMTCIGNDGEGVGSELRGVAGSMIEREDSPIVGGIISLEQLPLV